jgi:hypothetical protein
MPDEAVSLKQYIDALSAARDEALHAALAANEKRLDGMNEFRQTLKDQQATYVTRVELFGWLGAAVAVGASLGHLWR